jgi:hypothetical protein
MIKNVIRLPSEFIYRGNAPGHSIAVLCLCFEYLTQIVKELHICPVSEDSQPRQLNSTAPHRCRRVERALPVKFTRIDDRSDDSLAIVSIYESERSNTPEPLSRLALWKIHQGGITTSEVIERTGKMFWNGRNKTFSIGLSPIQKAIVEYNETEEKCTAFFGNFGHLFSQTHDITYFATYLTLTEILADMQYTSLIRNLMQGPNPTRIFHRTEEDPRARRWIRRRHPDAVNGIITEIIADYIPPIKVS